MPEKEELTRIVDGELVLLIGSSDESSDWLKRIDGGKRKKKDLAATDAALRKHKKDSDA